MNTGIFLSKNYPADSSGGIIWSFSLESALPQALFQLKAGVLVFYHIRKEG